MEERSTVTNRFPCLGCFEKSLIWPKEAVEARSLRSHPRFQCHCGILATGFPEGGNEDHITYHLLEVFEKPCGLPRNTLKEQLHFGCADETPECSEGVGESGDCPKALEDKTCVWLLI